MRSLAVTAFCLATFTPAIAAGGRIYDTVFAKAGSPCFSRTYDKAHLKTHPRQTVSGIQLEYTRTNDDGTPNKADAFEISLSFQLKSGDGWFAGPATCKTKDGAFSCSLEADGGQFSLTPSTNALTFTVINQSGTDAKADQIRLEGGDTFGSFGKPGGDDLVFVIPKVASTVCSSGGY